jgi:hypothetical protein
MRQPMLAKPIGRFALGKVEACTGLIDLMVDRLAISLTGNAAFSVYHFHKPIQHQRNGFVDPGRIVWKDGFGFVGDLQDSFPEGDPSRGCRVLCEGVAFPVLGCYHCHCSIPHIEGLTVWRVMHAWRLSHTPFLLCPTCHSVGLSITHLMLYIIHNMYIHVN